MQYAPPTLPPFQIAWTDETNARKIQKLAGKAGKFVLTTRNIEFTDNGTGKPVTRTIPAGSTLDVPRLRRNRPKHGDAALTCCTVTWLEYADHRYLTAYA